MCFCVRRTEQKIDDCLGTSGNNRIAEDSFALQNNVRIIKARLVSVRQWSAIDSPRCKCSTMRMKTRIAVNGASNAALVIKGVYKTS